jgi:hypothetical protein
MSDWEKCWAGLERDVARDLAVPMTDMFVVKLSCLLPSCVPYQLRCAI